MINFGNYLVSEIKPVSTLPLSRPPYSNKGLGQFIREKLSLKKKGVTLAEMLITLTIIGVIAALTISNLMSKYRKHEVEVKVKEAYSFVYNLVEAAKHEHGALSEWDYGLSNNEFNEKYVEPYIKYNERIITRERWNYQVNDLTDTVSSIYASLGGAPAYKLDNGMILIMQNTAAGNHPKASFGVDINGLKGPNAVGKDVFMFFIPRQPEYDTNTIAPCRGVFGGDVACPRYASVEKVLSADGDCTLTRASYYNGGTCTAVIMYNNWRIPDNYPVKF